MSEKKTSVEWLIEQIIASPIDPATNAVFLKSHVNRAEIFDKAAEMHRREIALAYESAKMDSYYYHNPQMGEKKHRDWLDYYEKTYGNNTDTPAE